MSLQRVIAMPAIAACLLLSGLSRAHGTEVAARDQPAPPWITDSAITVAVTTKLAAQHFSHVTRLKVQTDKGGVVSLGGTTPSRSEAARAAAIARGIGGVLRVNNHIVVRGDAH
jgi:osmotically-inducible protein OsmY